MGMEIYLFILMTGTMVICATHNETSIQPVQEPIPRYAEEPKPIRLIRKKRMWVLAPFFIEEEDEGPFPKFGANINHGDNKHDNIKFEITGTGVDMPPEKGLFKLDSENILWIQRKVDREQVHSFNVIVNAMENGEQIDESLIYHVKVIDINDNKPIFNESFYRVNVPENTPVDKIFFNVTATDQDEKNNPNSEISYWLDPEATSSKYFSLDQSGSMSLKTCLDYEKDKSYTIIVHANDNGSPKLSSSTTVHIRVQMANKHLPIFTQTNFIGKVFENYTNVVILRLSVTDADVPNTPAWRAMYRIVEGNERGLYKIETDKKSNDGILTLIKHLDFEAGERSQLKIAVENEDQYATCEHMSKKAPEFAHVVIYVEDANDAPIVIPPQARVDKKEDLIPGSDLFQFTAIDPDKSFQNYIRFVIGYDPASWVTVNQETGMVTTLKILDRESSYVSESGIYKVIVHAVDDATPPLTGTGVLNIFLNDVNDNVPYLISSKEMMCDEGDMWSVILKAADNDLRPYSSPFTFELLDSAKEKWKLGKTTDQTVELMRISKVVIGNYTIRLNIRDQQGLGKESILSLHICHCDHKNTCSGAMTRTAILGTSAIIALFAGFLFLLIGACLLFMNEKHFEPSYDFQKFSSSIRMYNEEEKCPVDNPIIFPYISRRESGAGIPSQSGSQMSQCKGLRWNQIKMLGFEKNSSIDINNAWSKSVNIIHIIAFDQGNYLVFPACFHVPQHYEDFVQNRSEWIQTGILEKHKKSSNAIHNDKSVAWRISTGYHRRQFEDILLNRVKVHNDVNYIDDEPHVYHHEGEDNTELSVDGLNADDNAVEFNYLDNIGPPFKPLANICQQYYQTLNSTGKRKELFPN